MTATATSVIQQRNSDMVELLKPDFVTRSELTYLTAVDQYMRLPCLRYLGLGGLGSGGEWRDASNNGMDLAYNGNPTMGYTDQGAPRWAYDGAGDCHSHADDAHFDITGTETTVAAARNGLTLGCWAAFSNAATATEVIMEKYGTANNKSYRFYRSSTGIFTGQISTNGTTDFTNAFGGVTVGTSWNFLSMRFTPSTELKLWINDGTDILAAAVPASIFSGTSQFTIAANAGTSMLMTGRVAFPFVCACTLSDALIGQLYQSSRGLFGV